MLVFRFFLDAFLRLIIQVLLLLVKWLVRCIFYAFETQMIMRAERRQPVEHEEQEGKL